MSSIILMFETEAGVEYELAAALKTIGLEQTHVIHRIAPDHSKGDALVGDAINRARPLLENGSVALVLVDIVVDEKRKLDRGGFSIARVIRQSWPSLPLYLMSSKHGTSPLLDEIISEASLEDVDGVLVKSYATEQMSRATLKRLLECPRRQFARPQHYVHSQSEAMTEPVVAAVRERFRDSLLDPRLRLLERQFGRRCFWMLVQGCVGEATGTLQVMHGGRSGAVVVKARIDLVGNDKARVMVLKMSADVAEVRREVANYARVPITRLARRRVPRCITPAAVECEGFAAMAVELEEDCIPIRGWFQQSRRTEHVRQLASQLCDALGEMYYGGGERTAYPWRRYYELSDDVRINIELALDELAALQVSLIKNDVADRVKAFVRTDAAAIQHPVRRVETKCVERQVHGDLNAGNVLVTPGNDVVLIDHASSIESSVCWDLAKLERDIIYRACDAGTTSFFDWATIGGWQRLVSVSLGEEDATLTRASAAVKATGAFLREFKQQSARSIAKNVSAEEADMAMLHFVLKAFLLEDISIQKKVLAVWHCDQLLRRLGA